MVWLIGFAVGMVVGGCVGVVAMAFVAAADNRR